MERFLRVEDKFISLAHIYKMDIVESPYRNKYRCDPKEKYYEVQISYGVGSDVNTINIDLQASGKKAAEDWITNLIGPYIKYE